MPAQLKILEQKYPLLWYFTVAFVLIMVSCGPDAYQNLKSPPSLPNSGVGRVYQEFYLLDSIRIVLDIPVLSNDDSSELKNLVIYALPNGNSIEWTMGKQRSESDDWHFGIQHIDAQTQWLREKCGKHFILAYLEAPRLSWPAWRRSHVDTQHQILTLLDTLRTITHGEKVVLSSHSGGGSLINGFIETSDKIPDWVERIIFIDSNYGYTTEIGEKLSAWIRGDSVRHLSVFAYNDSIALYEGKPFVSATGGTWYRSKMMVRELKEKHEWVKSENEDFLSSRSVDNQI